MNVNYCDKLYIGSGDLHSGLQACAASILVTEPFPQPAKSMLYQMLTFY